MPHEFTETASDQQPWTTTAPNSKSSEPAEQALTESEPALEVETVAKEVSAEAAKRKRTVAWGSSILIVLMSVLYIGFFVCMGSVLGNWEWTAPVLVCYGLLLLLTLGVALRIRVSRKSRELMRRRMDFLATRNDVAASGALLDVLAIERGPVRGMAAQSLAQVAPRWSDEVVASLTTEQRTLVRRLLRGVDYGFRSNPDTTGPGRGYGLTGLHAELRIALCAGLSRTGSQEDLQVLRQIAKLPALTLQRRKVRAAAREAVIHLEARMAELNTPRTLMRASSAPRAHSDELLRAASAASDPSPDELLRASDGGTTPLV